MEEAMATEATEKRRRSTLVKGAALAVPIVFLLYAVGPHRAGPNRIFYIATKSRGEIYRALFAWKPAEVYLPPYPIPNTTAEWIGYREIGRPFPPSIQFVMGVTTGHSASFSLSQPALFENCSHVLVRFEK